MSNPGNLVQIPSDQGVDIVVLNTNVSIADVRVHVQTEEVKPKKLIVTCVLYEGQVIDRVERSYADVESKPNIRELIAKVANAQHGKRISEVPGIWKRFSPTIKRSIRPLKVASLRPVLIGTPQLDTGRALELFELGLTLYRDEPLRAKEAWEEASRLDPDNKVYRVNLKRLNDLSRGVLANDRNAGCFSACFKQPARISGPPILRLVKPE